MATSNASSAGSSSHELSSFATAALPSEFYVTVDLYLSKMAMQARKSQIPRRKPEKRDSMRSASSSGDLHQRKIKEKASWLGLSRGHSNAEQWRSATCKLVEEDEGCLLNVYLDDTALYQSVYVHKLNHTDIRQVHHSLFDRKDCLGIFCTPEQTWNPTAFTEPLYLHFSDTEILNTWVVLLRSYAQPEVYGRWLSARDGGLYRMWRQVELVCLQGRNLGISRSTWDDPSCADAEAREGDSIDLDIYCDFLVNNTLSGRTTVKKGLGSPDWHEKFSFTDLPPFENLEILIFREKRLLKPVLIGSTIIPLMNFRRGEHIEGWFPVLGGQGYAGVVMGEIRLKLKVDEEIILPYAMYSDMLKALQAKNLLDWVAELDSKLEVKNISDHIIAIAKAKNILMKNIMELADREVDGTPQSHGTLFRGNTVFTKTMEILMVAQGGSFLEASIGSVIRRLCSEKVAIEIDPARSQKNSKNVEKQSDLLVFWCQEFWKSIYEARKRCPDDMRKLFGHIRQLIETRYGGENKNPDLPWQGVSSFLFLRFFVPAILHPHLFGIWPGLTEESVQRTLTLIAKVMQSLANLNMTLQKEHYMRPVQEFLTNSNNTMIDYIVSVSSPETSQQEALPTQVLDRHERVRIMNTLHQRHSKAPILHREAIPLLPHMVDLPKHLAVIGSVVVRHTRRKLPNRTGVAAEITFDEFCSSCLQVEEQALRRVSQLASKRRPHNPSSSKSPSYVSVGTPSPIAASNRERKSSLPNKLRSKRRPQRPATAPDTAVQLVDSSDDVSLPSSPTLATYDASLADNRIPRSPPPSSFPRDFLPHSMPAPRPTFMHHPRSTSTDSALSRENTPSRTPSAGVDSLHHDAASDNPDESMRKARGLLRGILRK